MTTSSIAPYFYSIVLDILHDTWFKGSCVINLVKKSNDSIIALHSRNLKYMNISINNGSNEMIGIQQLENDVIEFHFKTPFSGDTCLKIDYQGPITKSLYGIVKKTTAIYSHFEPSYARSVFPCIDEPNVKARFQLSLIVPNSIGYTTVLSNTTLVKKTIIIDTTAYTFSQTPVMSTYLLAFYIGNTNVQSIKTKNNIRLSLYYNNVDQDLINKLLIKAARCIEYISDLLGLPYVLDKLDIVTVPDFEPKAMENWGLILIKHSLFKNMEGLSNALYVICHEICHQWFGNLVTAKTWNDIWLNEGLTTWLSWHVISVMVEDKSLETRILTNEIFVAMRLDSLTMRPVVTDGIDVFDSITYAKGASVMKMIETMIGLDKLIIVLKGYLIKFCYSNATTYDLLECFSQSGFKHISLVLHKWLTTTRHPYLSIESIDNRINITQHPVCFVPECHFNTWQFPVSTEIMTDKKMFLKKKYIISDMNFYRIFYDDKSLNSLFNDSINANTILRLLNDAIAFWIIGICNEDYLIKIIKGSYFQLDNPDVLNYVCSIVSYLRKIFNEKHCYEKVKKAIIPLINSLPQNNKTKAILLTLDDKQTIKDIITEYNETKKFFTSAIIFHPHRQKMYERLISVIKKTMRINEYIIILARTDNYNFYIDMLCLFFNPKANDDIRYRLLENASKNALFGRTYWSFIKINWTQISDLVEDNFFGLSSIVDTLQNIVDKDGSIRHDIIDFFQTKNISSYKNSFDHTIRTMEVNTHFYLSNK